MNDYFQVTNNGAGIVTLSVTTDWYRHIDLRPGESVSVLATYVNKPALESFGCTVTGPTPLDRDDEAFGQAHDRILAEVQGVYEEFSWHPATGWPTHEDVGYDFRPGTIFRAQDAGTVPGLPTPVSIAREQRIKSLVFSPDGEQNSHYEVLPVDEATSNVSESAIEAVINAMGIAGADGGKFQGSYTPPGLPTSASGTVRPGDSWQVAADGQLGGEDVKQGDLIIAKVQDPASENDFVVVKQSAAAGPDDDEAFFDTFAVGRWSNGELTYPAVAHGLAWNNRPYDVTVTDEDMSEVELEVKTNSANGDVTLVTDGAPFAGTVTITQVV